ncbi:MAG TPA: hypothetical protein VN449_11285 [Gaiellaceae bacterium]|nr:hypothetical protein [Gaiellaceae bacterium]
MECGVEDRDVGDVRQLALRVLDRRQRRGIVQRRERRQLADRRLDAVVDHGRLDEPRPAVDDAVADRTARDERLDGARLVALDEVQLQARRPRVDDEDFQPGQVQSRTAGTSSPSTRV